MNILLLTSYFPPDAHIGAMRWYRIGKALIAAGHQLHVISADNRSRLSMYHASQKGFRDISPSSVTRVSYPVRSTLLHWLLRTPGIAGRMLMHLRNQLFSSKKELSVNRPNSLGGYVGHSKRLMMIMYRRCFFPHNSWSWGRHVVGHASKLMESQDINMIVATHPFPGTLRAAALLSKKYGVPWIADMRDPFHNDHQLEDSWTRQRLFTIERAILETSSAIVTINSYLAEMLATSSRVEIIPNCYEENQSLGLRIYNTLQKTVTMTYTGTVHSNDRYTDFFESLLCLPAWNAKEPFLRLLYYGHTFSILRNYVDSLLSKGICIVDCGFVSSELSRQALDNSDLLLVFGWRGPGYRCVMTGKAFDYLSVRKPIIAITEGDTALGVLIGRTGAGIVLDGKEEIQQFFISLRKEPREILDSLAMNRKQDVVDEYSVSTVARKYERLLYEITGGDYHRT